MRRWLSNLMCVSFAIVITCGISDAQQSRTSRSRKASSSAEATPAKLVAGDWNQFLWANRDNLSPETGFGRAVGPKVAPSFSRTITGIGEGYASVSLVGDLMYTMGNVDGGEQVIALNRKTGESVWKTRNGDEYREGQGNGPRGTPTVVDGMVYSLGGNGDLSCLNASNGEVVWQINILREFGG